MLVAENVDCNKAVCQFLSYVDIICIKNINKLHYQYIVLPDFKQLFMKKLVECEVVPTIKEANLFCDALYDTGAYVAGSFILDYLLDTDYHHDIDIYDQTGIDRYPDGEYTNSDMFSQFGDKNLQFTQYLYNNNFENIIASYDIIPILRSFINKSSSTYKAIGILDIDKLKNTIQMIPVNLKLKHGKRSVIPRFIKASFDLEICQNIFDGKKIYIKNVDKLVHKYDYIKINTMFTLAVYGGRKQPPYYDYKKKVTMKRMGKYISRGFDIKLHPQQEEMYDMINKLFDNKHNARYFIKYVDDGTIDLSIYDFQY